MNKFGIIFLSIFVLCGHTVLTTASEIYEYDDFEYTYSAILNLNAETGEVVFLKLDAYGNYVEVEDFNANQTVHLTTGGWSNVHTFLNIDWGNLRVTSHANNPGTARIQVFHTNNGSLVDTGTVTRGGTTTLTTSGAFRNHTLSAQAMTFSGNYSFSLRW